jgi:hypothetical protein
VRVLLFGSRTFLDPAPIGRLLDAARPDLVIEGESPGGGADILAREQAEARGIVVLPCPVDHALDGPWPAAGHRRNERMFRLRPTHAAGFISGKVGTPFSRGSAGMARICERGLPGFPPIPLVIYRDDGIDLPGGDALGNALALLRLLFRGTPEVAAAGAAVRVALEARAGGASPGDVAALVAGALGEVEKVMGEQPRAAPWLAVVTGLLGRALAVRPAA